MARFQVLLAVCLLLAALGNASSQQPAGNASSQAVDAAGNANAGDAFDGAAVSNADNNITSGNSSSATTVRLDQAIPAFSGVRSCLPFAILIAAAAPAADTGVAAGFNTAGSQGRLIIEADDSVIRATEARVEDGILTLSLLSGFETQQPVNFTVVMPVNMQLRYVANYGSGLVVLGPGHVTTRVRLLAPNIGQIQTLNLTTASVMFTGSGVLGSFLSGAFQRANITTTTATGSIVLRSYTPVELGVNLAGITTVLADLPEGSQITGTAAGLSKVQYTNGRCSVNSDTPQLFAAPSIFGPSGFSFGGGGGLVGSKCQQVSEADLLSTVQVAEQPTWTCGIIVDGSLSCRGANSTTVTPITWVTSNVSSAQETPSSVAGTPPTASPSPATTPSPLPSPSPEPEATSPPATPTTAPVTASPEPVPTTPPATPTTAPVTASPEPVPTTPTATPTTAPATTVAAVSSPPAASAANAGAQPSPSPAASPGLSPVTTEVSSPPGSLTTGAYTSGPGSFASGSSSVGGSQGSSTQTTTSQGGSNPQTNLSTAASPSPAPEAASPSPSPAASPTPATVADISSSPAANAGGQVAGLAVEGPAAAPAPAQNASVAAEPVAGSPTVDAIGGAAAPNSNVGRKLLQSPSPSPAAEPVASIAVEPDTTSPAPASPAPFSASVDIASPSPSSPTPSPTPSPSPGPSPPPAANAGAQPSPSPAASPGLSPVTTEVSSPPGSLTTGAFTSGPGSVASGTSSVGGSQGSSTQTTTSQGGSNPQTTLSTGGVGSEIFNPLFVPAVSAESFNLNPAASPSPPPEVITAAPVPAENLVPTTASPTSVSISTFGPGVAFGVAVANTACRSTKSSLNMLLQPDEAGSA